MPESRARRVLRPHGDAAVGFPGAHPAVSQGSARVPARVCRGDSPRAAAYGRTRAPVRSHGSGGNHSARSCGCGTCVGGVCRSLRHLRETTGLAPQTSGVSRAGDACGPSWGAAGPLCLPGVRGPKTAQRVITLSADVASERTAERVKVVLNRLEEYRDVPEVREVLDEAA